MDNYSARVALQRKQLSFTEQASERQCSVNIVDFFSHFSTLPHYVLHFNPKCRSAALEQSYYAPKQLGQKTAVVMLQQIKSVKERGYHIICRDDFPHTR